MDEKYDPWLIETRWQERWEREGAFAVGEGSERPKYYLLEMFPYPSGKIHMGHVRNYSIGDVVARYKRMRGFNVLHPMGWDAFGLPAENAAIQNRVHPARWTQENIAHMRRQLKRLGFSYDWSRELATCDPSYYKGEQIFFLRMLERGLAYKRLSRVNWCPSCATVLANEQVEEGCCWRCGGAVHDKELEQWFLRITEYAQALLAGCDRLSQGWPEKVLTMQRNWIGKSLGAEIHFPLVGRGDDITVFTTRQDTVFGATFMSLAVEHPLVVELSRGTPQEEDVRAFVRRVGAQSRAERAEGKEGVFLGAYCRNPVTGWRMPVYAANFVLMEYGTGAVMAVPAHDQRDFEFARAYGLPVVVVVQPHDAAELRAESMAEAYEGAGRLAASGEFSGLDSEEGKEKIVEYLEASGLGRRSVQYRLRDWCISRQRYWGAPIPVVYCGGGCGMVPVPEAELPVVLPLDVELTGEGGSPLAKHAAFVETTCPRCAGRARRETDTMDTFVESSWYFARFASPHEQTDPLDRSAVRYWMPVDLYIGGIEHAVLHLLYARFFTKVLRDLGWTDADEPFTGLLTQGMVGKETFHCPEHEWLYPDEVDDGRCKRCGREVVVGRTEKMSKSRRNVVEPDALIERYGADTVRLFCLFAAPPEKDVEWNDQAVEGMSRFLGRLWRLVWGQRALFETAAAPYSTATLGPEGAALRRVLHRTIQRVNEDVEVRLHFNTAVAAVMELINQVQACIHKGTEADRPVVREALENVVVLLFPFVPHIAAELWREMGRSEALDDHPWPAYDPRALVSEEVTIVVQINGRVRGRITVPADADQAEVLARAVADEHVRGYVRGKPIKKTVFVPGRLMSLAV